MLEIETSLGTMVAELDAKKAPESVKNFLQYVADKYYDGTIFHRVMKDFMIQGGGFTINMTRKPTRESVQNEAKNGLKNKRGTLAMARISDPHSATSQFFINHRDNASLDYPAHDGWGYAVFGKLISGQDILDKIAVVKTSRGNVPVEPVVIQSIRLVSLLTVAGLSLDPVRAAQLHDAAQNGEVEMDLVSAARNGDVSAVNTLLTDTGDAAVDTKSRALMMAVWGALHTSSSTSFNFRNGQLQQFETIERTSSVPRDTYLDIIRLLHEAGAESSLFKFRDFDSVAVKKYLSDREKVEALRSSGAFSSITAIGGESNTTVDLVPGSEEGLSIREVAEIEGADDVIRNLVTLPAPSQNVSYGADSNAKRDDGNTALHEASSKWGMVPPLGCYWECTQPSGCPLERNRGASAEPGDYEEYREQPGAPHPLFTAYFLPDGRAINFLVLGGETRVGESGPASGRGMRTSSDPFGFHLNPGWVPKCTSPPADVVAAPTFRGPKTEESNTAEQRAWESAVDTGTPFGFSEYVDKYPASPRIRTLTGTVRGRYWFNIHDQGQFGVIVTVEGMNVLLTVSLEEAKRLKVIGSRAATPGLTTSGKGRTFNWEL